MPLTRISLRAGTPASYRRAIMEGVYKAVRDTFNVPENDRFMTVSEHDGDSFDYGARRARKSGRTAGDRVATC